jgi:hypothetical protein
MCDYTEVCRNYKQTCEQRGKEWYPACFSSFTVPPASPGPVLSDLLYGVVEWINDMPILDGMPYFTSMDDALKYAEERQNMGAMGLPCSVRYTVISLRKAV